MGSPASQLSDTLRQFLKALAGENRQQTMLLLFAGGAAFAVGTVAERLGIGQSTASEHLARLRQGGLLVSRREGKTVFYRADPRGIGMVLDELQGYLRSCCPG